MEKLFTKDNDAALELHKGDDTSDLDNVNRDVTDILHLAAKVIFSIMACHLLLLHYILTSQVPDKRENQYHDIFCKYKCSILWFYSHIEKVKSVLMSQR